MVTGKDWVSDFFGEMPMRPTDDQGFPDPDWMKLSEVLLRHDAMIEPGMSEDEKQANFERAVADVGIKPTVLAYASIQRAMRPYGITTAGELAQRVGAVGVGSGLWTDAFIVGALWAEKVRGEVRTEIGVRDNASGEITGGFDSEDEARDWIARNPMNFGPANFDVVTREVTVWS